MDIDPKCGLTHIESVTIMGQEIQLKHRKPKKASHGECDADQRTIELNNSLEGEFAVRVLIHELTHSGLRLSGIDYHLTEAVEEQICTLMESLVPEIATIIIQALQEPAKEE